MYGLPLQHTVDDVMAIGMWCVVDSGNHVLMKTTEISGWDVPDSKPPLPLSDTCLLGADVRHREHGSELDLTEAILDTLEQLLIDHLNANQLSVGAAGKFYGRLLATVPSPTGSGVAQNLDQSRHGNTTTTMSAHHTS